jgi:hypothetical protein
VLGEPERAGERQRGAQDLLALGERQRANIPAARVQDVEYVVEHRHVGQQVLARAGLAEPLLQPLEPGLAAVEGDDLPVDHALLCGLRGQRVGHLGERGGDLVLVARHQPDLAAAPRDVGEAALAVELALENPRRVGEPVSGERGKLRIHPLGQVSLRLLFRHPSLLAARSGRRRRRQRWISQPDTTMPAAAASDRARSSISSRHLHVPGSRTARAVDHLYSGNPPGGDHR